VSEKLYDDTHFLSWDDWPREMDQMHRFVSRQTMQLIHPPISVANAIRQSELGFGTFAKVGEHIVMACALYQRRLLDVVAQNMIDADHDNTTDPMTRLGRAGNPELFDLAAHPVGNYNQVFPIPEVDEHSLLSDILETTEYAYWFEFVAAIERHLQRVAVVINTIPFSQTQSYIAVSFRGPDRWIDDIVLKSTNCRARAGLLQAVERLRTTMSSIEQNNMPTRDPTRRGHQHNPNATSS
jgi:hypothetical protein